MFTLGFILGAAHSMDLDKSVISYGAFSLPLKVLCVLPTYLPTSPHPPSPGSHCFFAASIFLSFLECHIVGAIQDMAFSDCHFSLMHLSFLYIFHDLIAYSFLVLNKSSLSGYLIVYLSISGPQDILVASEFWQLWIKLLWSSLVAQWLKDPVLSLLGCRFNPWTRKFCMLRVQGKKKLL